MPELIARGIVSGEMWQHELPEGVIVIGRDESNGPWATPWDPQISRKHAEVTWKEGKLHVRRVEAAKNPIFLRGMPSDEFTLEPGPGEQFAIGDTVFSLLSLEASSFSSATPFTEMTCSADELK